MAYQRELWPVALVAITGPKPLHTDFSTERSIRTDARCQHAAEKLIVISRPTPISARTFGSFYYRARRDVRIHQRDDIRRSIGAARCLLCQSEGDAAPRRFELKFKWCQLVGYVCRWVYTSQERRGLG